MSPRLIAIFLVGATTVLHAGPNLTVYAPAQSSRTRSSSDDATQGFASVRDTVPLTLQEGDNEIVGPPVSPLLDPASVMLRDRTGTTDFRVVLQQFRSDVLTDQAMMARFEGQTIAFLVREGEKSHEVIGKIIRAGYWKRSGENVEETFAPIIEVDGRYVFTAPGTPIFPKLPDGEILKPELRWRIAASKPVKVDAELMYSTNGLTWQADYNALMKEDGKIAEFIAWITLTNNTGVRFENSNVKLVAGNIRRLRSELRRSDATTERVIVTGSYIPTGDDSGPSIQRRAFDEYHEYSLPKPTTLADREMTQVEFVYGTDVPAIRSFIYDGSTVKVDNLGLDYAQLDSGFGTESTSKVAITSEFRNDAANHLGVPLPEGQVHFYRPNADGNLQFTGDSNIGNTPQDETVRAATGYAFDLVGERVQKDFQIDDKKATAEETYEIKVRNHRKEPAEVRVWEHPCRWRQWEIVAQSQPFKKLNQQTFEFLLSVPPNGEKSLTYKIRYTQMPPRR